METAMLRIIPIVMVMLMAASGSALAQGDGLQGRWNVTFAGGASVPTGGSFHDGGFGSVLGLPTSVDEKSYNDVYDAGFGWSAMVGYGVSRNVELFGGFAWTRAEAQELSVGNVAGLDLRAAFEDYTSYGLDGGVRVHFAPGATVNPYAAGVLGFRRIESIPATFSVPAAGVTLADTPFYDASTVMVLGADFGVLFSVSDRVYLGVESGLRYHTGLSDIEGLAGTGLENLNDVGRRWSVPVSAVVRVGF
jgi:hypothetical protein